MCTEIVEHHGDASGLRVMDIDKGFDLLGEVARGTMLTHLDMAPSGLWLEQEEEIGGAAPAVFIIDALRAPRCGRQRRADFREQLPGLLIKTDDRALRIVGLGIKIENIFHPPDKIGPHLGDAPMLLAPRLQSVFFSVRRTVSSLTAATTWSATSRSASNCMVQRAYPSGG